MLSQCQVGLNGQHGARAGYVSVEERIVYFTYSLAQCPLSVGVGENAGLCHITSLMRQKATPTSHS
jgi:hypothetical protein